MAQLSKALDWARASGIPASILEAQVRVAFLHFRLGHYARAQKMGAQALALDTADTTSQVDAWLVLGNCAAETNDLSAAEDSFLHAESELASDLNDDRRWTSIWASKSLVGLKFDTRDPERPLAHASTYPAAFHYLFMALFFPGVEALGRGLREPAGKPSPGLCLPRRKIGSIC